MSLRLHFNFFKLARVLSNLILFLYFQILNVSSQKNQFGQARYFPDEMVYHLERALIKKG